MERKIKSWKDYDDLLKLLSIRKMDVENQQRTLHYLKNIGYYRLSGYWYPFKQKDEQNSQKEQKTILLDEFKTGTCFSDILALYIFDKQLRFLALDALERIEMAVKNDVVHLLGKLHPLAHIEPYQIESGYRKKSLLFTS
ncbi:Abi family protein [Histophilus somni]